MIRKSNENSNTKGEKDRERESALKIKQTNEKLKKTIKIVEKNNFLINLINCDSNKQ